MPASVNSASSLLESRLPDLVTMRRAGMARSYEQGTHVNCLPEKNKPAFRRVCFVRKVQC
jgi:hypothetical protein